MDELSASEAVEILNPSGAGDFVLVCEHASSFIPVDLHDLGLSEQELRSHIAWDAGALAVARIMSGILDAPLVAAKMSRLVYDCNRAPGVESAVITKNDGIAVPGNTDLAKADLIARQSRVYQPFCEGLGNCLAHRDERGKTSMLVTVHSFTPVMNGIKRYLGLGVLHDTDTRLADEILAIAHIDGSLRVRRNEPYGIDDDVTHTLKEHGLSKDRLNVMLEIRNDLILDAAAQKKMGERLSSWLLQAHKKLLAGRKDTPDGW